MCNFFQLANSYHYTRFQLNEGTESTFSGIPNDIRKSIPTVLLIGSDFATFIYFCLSPGCHRTKDNCMLSSVFPPSLTAFNFFPTQKPFTFRRSPSYLRNARNLSWSFCQSQNHHTIRPPTLHLLNTSYIIPCSIGKNRNTKWRSICAI